MRKIIAAINMTLDGFCDHTSVIPDDAVMQHYIDLLRNADTILYGRITYQLMEKYWPGLVRSPSSNQPDNDFAIVIDNIAKIVFSNTLKDVAWKNTRLAKQDIKEEVLQLRQQPGKDILIGSRSLIIALLHLGLIDEFQLCIHPVIAGKGLALFGNINNRVEFKLLKTKTFNSHGAVVFYYQPTQID